MIDFSKVKLLVWDLDDTFWRGTLSEGGVSAVESNINLVKQLTDIGIVNSICSKNDEDVTIEKLKEFGVDGFFVFKSIDWTPKGKRISAMIKDMGLRNVNVLFLDDNPVNRNEALHYCDGLMAADPQEVLPLLGEWVLSQEKKDLAHKRLKQYQVLETKVKSRGEFSSNLEFLYSTQTVVEIKKDCLTQTDRLHELIHRTNQLNYTKKRISREELVSILENKAYNTGYVTVKDKFGDYGIVGFFAIKDNIAEHFLFSCRAIGQGVEQWVYSTLGFPELEVVGEVITKLEKVPAPAWINRASASTGKVEEEPAAAHLSKILFKGPCDMSIISSYLNFKGTVIEEYTYLGTLRHNEIEHHNHSENFLLHPFLDEGDRKLLTDECIFNDPDMFSSHMYDGDLDLIFLSTLPEPHLGVYRRKGSDLKVAFGEWTGDLTDPANWDGLVSGELFNYMNHYTKEYLQAFSQKYEYLGPIDENRYVENLEKLMAKISPKTHLCLILGSEVPYEGKTTPAYLGRAERHIKFNNAIRQFARGNNRIHLLNITDYIEGQESFTDNINHFQRKVYFRMSQRVSEIIAEVTGVKFREISPFKRYLKKLGAKYTSSINRKAWYYPLLAKVFHKLADK